VLYLVVILGITGFTIAAEEPGLWVLACGGVLLNGWLVLRGRFRPLPRWLANTITLGSMLFVTQQVWRVTGTPILLIGQFLVLLQLVKLFEQRANRDYAQLLVLSLLLVVAAAISTASLLFAMVMIIYLFISLYCCLLFHLKVETDKARLAQTLPAEKLNAATLRQDQRYLSRSMRRLTALVACVSLACSVFLFLFFPRGAGAGMLGQFQLRPPEVLTGFSDEAQFNQVAKITQNNTPVGTVRVEHNDQLVTTGMLRLRGNTFDVYVHNPRTSEWHWSRSGQPEGLRRRDAEAVVDQPLAGGDVFFPAGIRVTDHWRQTVQLDPIGSRALFALGGLTRFKTNRDVKLVYHRTDETLQRTDNLNQPIEYEVESNGTLAAPRPMALLAIIGARREFSKEIVDFAQAVVPAALRQQRPPAAAVTEQDEAIARLIEEYFKANFGYTLDLAADSALYNGNDPLAVFVSQTKRGHCEFFAGAMTLACQSLGLRARMVRGFVTDEYNRYSEVFQVRQSHAHAWVEVLTPDKGWVTFDPTSGRELPPNEQRSAWQKVKHVFDWMEFKWANSVVAYDGGHRDNLIQQLDTSMIRSAYRGQERISKIGRWWDELVGKTEFWSVSSKLLAGLITVMSLIIVGAVAWFFVERERIRRRAVKIGLEGLPLPDQIRLARQLGFYEGMMEVLHRRRVHWPRHLTPREFTQTLSFLPTEAYDTVDRLTRVYYRVRYGGARVQPAQQRRLEEVVRRLGEALGGGGRK
jgi:transglutaminase-like putative cysteine protease/Ca2+/Na+ antiporter